MRRDPLLLPVVLIALGMMLLAVAIILVAGSSGNDHATPTVAFKVNQRAGDGRPTQTLTVPKLLAQQTAAAFPDKAMRDETPPLAEQVAPGQLTAAQKAAARIKATQAPLPTAGASAGFAGCYTRFVSNQSSRNGVRPQLLVYHYTVSHNVAGKADVLAVVGLFSHTSSQASSNFVIDAEGNCYYIVPIEAKAWTQAAANPYSVSIEVIDYGNEATYMAAPGYLKLAQVSLEVSKRTGIPLRRGGVSGCAPTRSGIIQHADLGICGGGHHDIQPFSISQVVRIVQRLANVKAITAGQRKRCRELNTLRRHSLAYHHRFHVKGGRRLSRRERARAAAIRKGERKHGLRCKVGPPGKRGTLAYR